MQAGSGVGREGLLERERELSSLGAVVAEGAEGAARVVVIEGPAGIGKTQLVAEVRRRAADAGLRVLSARGGELEREFAFGVVRQLFEPAVLLPGRGGSFEGAAASARSIFEAPDAGAAETPGDASFAVLHGLFWLTVNLSAEAPLLIVVDDLHWCDRPSLRFLAYLVRRLEGLPVLLVVSLRPAEPGVDTALVAEIAGDPLAVSVHPRPLTGTGVAELVRARLGEGADEAFASACHSATGGNPLLLNELLKALAAEGVSPEHENVPRVRELGPRAASRAVLLRLGRLSEDAVLVARATAILGDDAELSVAGSLAELPADRAAAAADALARAEIFRPEAPLGFVHPLVRDAVYRDIPAGERALRHERAAHLLAELRAPAEQVAAQLLETPARGDGWVSEQLVGAARAALGKGAADTAVSLLQRALDEPPPAELRMEVLYELGHAEAMSHGPAGSAHLREAYELLTDPLRRAFTAQVLGLALLQTGEREEAALVARRAAAELPPELDDLRMGLEAFDLATTLFGVGALERMAGFEPYRTPPAGDGPGARIIAALAAMDWTYTGGPSGEITALALAALDGGQLIAADNGFSSIGAIMALAFADSDEALTAWDASIADAHRRGSLYAISSVHLWHGLTILLRGELEEAQQELEAAWDEFELWGFAELANIYCSGFLTLALLERGNLEGARQMAARGADPGFAADGVRFWLTSRLELAVAEGRAEEAIELAGKIERDYPRIANPAVGPWRSLKAKALDRLGRTAEALELARAEVDLAHAYGAPRALGRALRVLGTLEREDGVPHLDEAVAVLEGSPARLELAKALAALGGALRRGRRPADSREPLRRALELADACGAAGLADSVRSELYASGARPRTTALSGPASLTASEKRVVALAVDGQTNRDIAQTLFVTPKTVEVHLSNAYRKLGIRSRRELAAAIQG